MTAKPGAGDPPITCPGNFISIKAHYSLEIK
jgi:hypothetical protein